MYKFVETEKHDGKTTRTGGVTSVSVKAMRHIPKLGELSKVRGYCYKGRHGANHIGVMLHGEKGTIRFGGFSWGYGGTGPHGLNQLFKSLGLDIDSTEQSLGKWCDFQPGEFWSIDLSKKILTVKL